MRPSLRAVLFAGAFYPGATVALDFTAGRYRVNGLSGFTDAFASLPGLAVTRASVGDSDTISGSIIQFPQNTARTTDKGLLVEEGRTNLILQSQSFSGWSGNTINANVTTAPDGTATGGKVIEQAAGAGSVTQSAFASSAAAASTAYTHTIYAKAAERNWLYFREYDGTNNAGAWFNLSTGAIGNVEAGVTASIQAMAGGWYRCCITFTTKVGATSERVQVQIATANGDASPRVGDGVSGFYIWGGQLELGATPTSYIPTTSATATRANDVPQATFAFPTGPFTVVAIASLPSVDGTDRRLFCASDGTANNRVILRRAADNTALFSVGKGGVSQYSASAAGKTGARVLKMAVAFDGATYSAAVDGVSLASSAGAAPDAMTALGFGSAESAGGGAWLNGYLQRVLVYPYARADLQALTA